MLTAQQPKFFLFDVGNVIVDADHAITYKILGDFGVALNKAKLFYSNDEYLEFSRGRISADAFYQALTEKYLEFPLNYEQVVYAHNQHMYAANKEVEKIIGKMSSYKIGFVTDTNEWQTARERELVDLRKYSNIIFRSHELHMLKIDNGFFSYLASQLNERPENLLLIDDSPEKIALAEILGFHTITFKNPLQLSQALADFL